MYAVNMPELNDQHRALVEENIRLVYWRYSVWIKRPTGTMTNGDILSALYLGIMKAAVTYDESYGTKFSTHATRLMDQAVIRDIRWLEVRWKKEKHVLDLTYDDGEKPGFEINRNLEMKHMSTTPDFDRDMWQKELEGVLGEVLFDALGDNQLKIVYLYYYMEMNDQEIGDMMGVTRSAVHATRNRALARLKKDRRVRGLI